MWRTRLITYLNVYRSRLNTFLKLSTPILWGSRLIRLHGALLLVLVLVVVSSWSPGRLGRHGT